MNSIERDFFFVQTENKKRNRFVTFKDSSSSFSSLVVFSSLFSHKYLFDHMLSIWMFGRARLSYHMFCLHASCIHLRNMIHRHSYQYEERRTKKKTEKKRLSCLDVSTVIVICKYESRVLKSIFMDWLVIRFTLIVIISGDSCQNHFGATWFYEKMKFTFIPFTGMSPWYPWPIANIRS